MASLCLDPSYFSFAVAAADGSGLRSLTKHVSASCLSSLRHKLAHAVAARNSLCVYAPSLIIPPPLVLNANIANTIRNPAGAVPTRGAGANHSVGAVSVCESVIDYAGVYQHICSTTAAAAAATPHNLSTPSAAVAAAAVEGIAALLPPPQRLADWPRLVADAFAWPQQHQQQQQQQQQPQEAVSSRSSSSSSCSRSGSGSHDNSGVTVSRWAGRALRQSDLAALPLLAPTHSHGHCHGHGPSGLWGAPGVFSWMTLTVPLTTGSTQVKPRNHNHNGVDEHQSEPADGNGHDAGNVSSLASELHRMQAAIAHSNTLINANTADNTAFAHNPHTAAGADANGYA